MPGGQGPELIVAPFPQFHALQVVLNASEGRSPLYPVHVGKEQQVLPNGELGIHRSLFAEGGGLLADGCRSVRFSEYAVSATGRLQGAVEDPDSGGFASPVGTQQTEYFAGLHLQIHMFQGCYPVCISF